VGSPDLIILDNEAQARWSVVKDGRILITDGHLRRPQASGGTVEGSSGAELSGQRFVKSGHHALPSISGRSVPAVVVPTTPCLGMVTAGRHTHI
jgi:hypothetical protein